MAEKEQILSKLQRDYDTDIKKLTRKAEEAVKYFKEIALSRTGTLEDEKLGIPVYSKSNANNQQERNSRNNRFQN